MEQNLDRLLDRRDLLKVKLFQIAEELEEESNLESNNIHWLNLQMENIRRCYDDNEKIHFEICDIVAREHRKEYTEEYFRYNKYHNKLFVKIQTAISKLKNDEDKAKQEAQKLPVASLVPQQPIVVNAAAPHLQVPLPTFDGNLENWYSFKCMFQTIMDRYPNESPAIKLYHLKNSLIGSASDKIDQDVINNNDYMAAWKVLEHAYEDERLIIDTHIDALEMLPRMTREHGEELRKLIESCSKHVDALKNLQLPVAGLGEMILINTIAKRLDKVTRTLWESQLDQDERPSFSEMMDFLRERCRILQKVKGYPEHRVQPNIVKQKGKLESRNLSAKNFVQVVKECCPCCSSDHAIYKCEEFKKLSVADRYNRVKICGLCFNCLRRGHRTVDCKCEQSCKTCRRKHHSLLHEDITNARKDSPIQVSATATTSSNGQSTVQTQGSVNCAQLQTMKKQVLLSTANVLVCGSGGFKQACRALLDSGSDSNIMSEKFARSLNIAWERIDLPITGLNNAETQVRYKLRTKIISRVNQFEAVLDFLVVPKVIANLPMVEVDIRSWPIPAGLSLADPSFHVPDEVQLIIGAELFYDLLKEGRMKINNECPTLVETQLGWIVSGSVYTSSNKRQRTVCHLAVTNEDLNQTLTKFWELEACGDASSLTAEEHAVETHFERTVSRDDDGRYTVRLPFNNKKDQLGDSHETAHRRFKKLLRTFIDDSKRIRYTAFMSEYLTLGHMVEVADNPCDGYFLPHHAVYKEASSTTKLRVVFDASAKTTSGLSLNDTLNVGPTVQSDLVSIILRFCSHQVVLTADVPKMYRQVGVHKDDWRYQRTLWLDEQNQITTFELTTVTYGCSSAPYLATRVLVQLAKDEEHDLPLAAKVVVEDSYVDDFLTGGRTADEVIEIYRQLSEMLKRGGFGVHKFCSNDQTVLNNIPEELQETRMDFENAAINNTIKTLGIIWNPNQDYFGFYVKALDSRNSSPPTKRNVLSDIGHLFDPLGFLGPIITTAKLVMQDLWRLGVAWDEELPQEQMEDWMNFRQQLPVVNKMKKKRCVISDTGNGVELHGFSDASNKAYGAVLYTRCVFPDGTINIELVCSKSRVAPLKPSTIPRLELCGALLLAHLVTKTIAAMKISFKSVTLWCDSQVVLCWLKKSPLAMNQFVSNRVATIIELTQDYDWQYVRSENNPADLISRGLLPEALEEHVLWWKGSPILREPEPRTDEYDGTIEIPELRISTVSVVKNVPPINFNRISNFRRLQRAWVYVLRFIANTRTKTRNLSEPTVQEMDEALRTVVKLVQQEAFGDLFKVLSSGSQKRNNYSGLSPFVDSDGLIRVGGRLKYSSIPYDGKHQILLPDKHQVTRTLVRKLHEEHLHVGQRGLLSIVRERFWPVNAKSLIKKTIVTCYACCRNNPRPSSQYMGDLPDYRITPSPVFANTGVDYAGPVILKEAGRKTVQYKAYIAVFICLATKAIHLELVSNLTTDNFVAALQRFISRRGMVSNIYSDNGTTFVGANHELAALRTLFEDQGHQRKLNDFCITKSIQWHFIPPRSPHFGGIWEAGVKSAKHHLKRVVGETKLTYEEMSTFLAQTEAILNSRPLIPVSDDPNDVEVLTPSHFLIGRSAVCLPEPSYDQEKIGRLSRWQHIQLMKEHFWKRWSGEYLHHLQSRPKWHNGITKFEVGSLVVLKDDNAPPHQWRIGRIQSTHPGKDGIVRVVTVKTSTGEYRRAITKVCLLPLVDPVESTGGE
ncbi:uncharacterized protein LOC135717444 [Ochlerotatus camptorhynchus]|uniref:uncharacterized protein LOC135717444 n=1 Tax=Ochlerotatus camptorhynchus TaxID=644619 RepID=UPI0031CFAEF8